MLNKEANELISGVATRLKAIGEIAIVVCDTDDTQWLRGANSDFVRLCGRLSILHGKNWQHGRDIRLLKKLDKEATTRLHALQDAQREWDKEKFGG